MKNKGVHLILSFCTFHFELELRLGFLMDRMLAAEPAILIQIQLIRRVSLILGR
jgi:hypothetical protein